LTRSQNRRPLVLYRFKRKAATSRTLRLLLEAKSHRSRFSGTRKKLQWYNSRNANNSFRATSICS